ncbi:hypothetical protein FAM15333_000601 [Propionibacterium freudenreichii]|uniref:hypothetical protein n=1 Tax=Propionibacterium freudenreichii TaxID=1744 RepID=UPI000BC313A5|nr:hypothetical protein [Propionibacterium freudenreichii]MDK9324662.1 hypothetical protein [Propionibacterium freudenreichii]MDK9347130.1 hypothetical protein [Propionibacterium freudenreichii]MDK9665884.1 hypothetical protein [Propionibacterium freudenreichii]SBM42798.1 Hypothetical protein PFR_JS2_639 [Propionibacterium freudenreichii]
MYTNRTPDGRSYASPMEALLAADIPLNNSYSTSPRLTYSQRLEPADALAAKSSDGRWVINSDAGNYCLALLPILPR